MGLKENVQCWLFGAISSEYAIKKPDGSFVRGTNSHGQYRSQKLFMGDVEDDGTHVSWEYYENQGYCCVEIIEKPMLYINIRDAIRDIISWINRQTGRIMSHGVKGWIADGNK